MSERSKYVKLYIHYDKYFEPLSNKEIGNLVMAMLNYFETGDSPEFIGNERFIWPTIKRDIDEQKSKIVINPESRNNAEYKEWRKLVFERDDYTCQRCGKRGGKLNAHHIERFRNCVERRTDVSNGVTLCEDCHKLIHRIEGR